jgi:hypothetical protein
MPKGKCVITKIYLQIFITTDYLYSIGIYSRLYQRNTDGICYALQLAYIVKCNIS